MAGKTRPSPIRCFGDWSDDACWALRCSAVRRLFLLVKFSLSWFFGFFSIYVLRLCLVMLRTPFTGGAEVLLGRRRRWDARERPGHLNGVDEAVALRDWRYGLVFGLWVFAL